MSVVDTYEGPFTPEQVEQLQAMLCLHTRDEARSVTCMIGGALAIYQIVKEARDRDPNVTTVLDQLGQIATEAASLARRLQEVSIAEELVRDPADWPLIEGFICMSDSSEKKQAHVTRLIDDLNVVARMANKIKGDDRHLRLALFHPPRDKVSMSSHALCLWPTLFRIWRWAGKRPAKTDGGPFHRYMALVHEACGLPEVKASTLKDAVARWQQDGPSKEMDVAPPWRTDPEDC